MKIYQPAQKDRQDSFWYDGVIADNNGWTLIVHGGQAILWNGELIWDGNERGEGLPFRFDTGTDTDLHDMLKSPECYIKMNNWFEVIPDSDNGEGYVCDTYDEAIKCLEDVSA